MTDENDQRDASAEDLARFLVEKIAPHERIIFDDALKAWRKEPKPIKLRGLGFDIGNVGTFVTPTAIMACSFLANVLAGLGANLVYDLTKKSWKTKGKLEPEAIDHAIAKVRTTLEREHSNLQPDTLDQVLTSLRETLGGDPAKTG